MATLSQTLNPLKRTASGGLEEAPNLKQAMANVGATNAPTAPIGGTLIGANPDATKMLGTQAQLNAATSRAQDQAAPVDSLQTAVRQQQSRTATTTTEQQKMQKSADMQALGGLGDRVTNFIDTQKQNFTTQNATLHATTGTNGVTNAAAETALNALAARPEDMELQKAANIALGRTPDQFTTITAAELPGLYDSIGSSISKSGAEVLDDSLSISNLIADPEFGYDANSLSSLLGLPADQISAMTVKQLTDAVNSTITSQFGEAAAVDQQATSGLAGQAERGLARSAGRELSSTGIRATEADTARLDAQIANADQVSFGGSTYQIEDLLNDETISNIITDYMNASEGSPTRDKLERSEPQLVDFIKRNDSILKDAAITLAHGADTFGKIQEQVKSLGTQGGVPVNTDLMSSLIEGFGKDYKTHEVDPSKVPFLAQLTGKTDLEKGVAITGVNKALENKRITPEEVGSLTPAELSGLNMTDPRGNFATYIANKDAAAEFAAIPSTDTGAQLQRMVTGGLTTDEIKSGISTGKARTALGIGKELDTGYLDVNDLPGSYARYNTPGTLADASKGVTSPKKIRIDMPRRLEGILDSLDMKLGQSAIDGDVSDLDMSNAKLTVDELIALEDNKSKPGAKIGDGVTNLRKGAATSYTKELLGPISNHKDGPVAGIKEALNQDPRKIDKKELRAIGTQTISTQARIFDGEGEYRAGDGGFQERLAARRYAYKKSIAELDSLGMVDADAVNAAYEASNAEWIVRARQEKQEREKKETANKVAAEAARLEKQYREEAERRAAVARQVAANAKAAADKYARDQAAKVVPAPIASVVRKLFGK